MKRIDLKWTLGTALTVIFLLFLGFQNCSPARFATKGESLNEAQAFEIDLNEPSPDTGSDGADTAADDGADTATDDGADTATDDGADTATDDGADTATDDGADTATDGGADTATDDGADTATDDGADDTADDGGDEPKEARCNSLDIVDIVFNVQSASTPGASGITDFTQEVSLNELETLGIDILMEGDDKAGSIVLHVSEAHVIDKDDNRLSLKVPSDKLQLKVSPQMELKDGQTYNIKAKRKDPAFKVMWRGNKCQMTPPVMNVIEIQLK